MATNGIPTSARRKVGSVALLLIGVILIYAPLFAAVAVTFLPGSSNDSTFWLLTIATVAVGAGLVWGGAALWGRWRTVLGGSLVFLSLWTTQYVFGLRSVATHEAGIEATWHLKTSKGYGVLAILLALIGVSLILYEKNKRKRSEHPK